MGSKSLDKEGNVEEVYSINKTLYNRIKQHSEDGIYMDGFCITVDIDKACFKMESLITNNSITIFSQLNTMRYIGYTISSLMSTVIGLFGYKSDMHKYIDKLVTELYETKTPL